MLKNNFESIHQNLDLFQYQANKLEAPFPGTRSAATVVLLLLRELESRLGLIDRISSCITDNRDQRYIDHTIKEIILEHVSRSQRAMRIVMTVMIFAIISDFQDVCRTTS